MTDAHPIVTRNAINFTPDNKRCWAYSGVSATSSTPTNFLDFHTESYYLVVTVQPIYLADSTNNIRYDIELNGQLVSGVEISTSRDFGSDNKLYLIIPPFTHVEVILDNLSAGTNNAGVTLIGDVFGITETGYQ